MAQRNQTRTRGRCVALALGAAAVAGGLAITVLLRNRGASAASEVWSSGLRAAHLQEVGWVELLADEREEPLGRAQLFIEHGRQTDAAAASHLVERPTGDIAWRGWLDPLRLDNGGGLKSGRYRLRVPHSGQELHVIVAASRSLGSGREYASVESADGVLPSQLVELGGN
jgi:hypothetical protein